MCALVILEEHLQILKKKCFICNDKRITDHNTCIDGVTGRFEIYVQRSVLLRIFF